MKKISKKLLLTGTIMLLLGACADTSDEEVASETVKVEQETENDEVPEDSSYFVDDLQTTFTVTPTKLPELTPEEEQIVLEINKHVDEVTSKPNYNDEGEKIYYGDRELVEQVAGDYPEYTAEELYNKRNDYYASRMYDQFGNQYISNKDHFSLTETAIRSNLKDPDLLDEWGLELRDLRWNSDYSKSINVDTYYYAGQQIEVKVYMSYNDDYSEATLERLVVDGEDAIEFTEEDAKEFEDVRY